MKRPWLEWHKRMRRVDRKADAAANPIAVIVVHAMRGAQRCVARSTSPLVGRIMR